MDPVSTRVFDLLPHLSAKADPRLVGADERHLTDVAATLDRSVAELSERLDTELRGPGGGGQQAMDRDLQVRRLGARLRTLRRHGADLCLGRMVPGAGTDVSDSDADSAAEDGPVYVGRLGLSDPAGRRLLVDWRSPAAEPFFGATHARPMGLASRRRYRWASGHVRDYWDEVFTPDGLEGHAALDDQSAFVASLGAARSGRMRDVLGTIQADQDAVVRAGSRGALVVDGGPGTGKTVVALHRAAYLVYANPRMSRGRGGVLVVGPHRPYLDYVSGVLPSLGEDGVLTCTLRDLVAEGAEADVETDPEVARLKADARLVRAVEPAVALYEEPPTEALVVTTGGADVRLEPADWAEAFDAPDPGTPHNEARGVVWDALLGILADKVGGDLPADQVRRAVAQDRELARVFSRAWPLLEAADVVGDLWTVPAYLRRCAPWLSREEVRSLQRERPQAWTVADLPLLDAARQRLGDPEAYRARRRREAALATHRARMDDVVADLVRSDDSEMLVMSMLRGSDVQTALADDSGAPETTPDLLAGPFAHVVVDEAQELTDAEWQMLLLRCPSRSLTVVGDRAQARRGFGESWTERLDRVGLAGARVASLRINYRTPVEVMAEAEPVVRAVLPDANVPVSVRSTGLPVRHQTVGELRTVVETWLDQHAEGTVCVVGSPAGLAAVAGDVPASPQVRSLTPETSKGLEFDLVVLVDPDGWGGGVEGAVDRYVAMTRATQELVVLDGAVTPATR